MKVYLAVPVCLGLVTVGNMQLICCSVLSILETMFFETAENNKSRIVMSRDQRCIEPATGQFQMLSAFLSYHVLPVT